MRKRNKEIDFVASDNLLDQKNLKLMEIKYRESIDREKFDFIESIAEKKKIEKYIIFTKKQFIIKNFPLRPLDFEGQVEFKITIISESNFISPTLNLAISCGVSTRKNI